jgi:hypothetical protein
VLFPTKYFITPVVALQAKNPEIRDFSKKISVALYRVGKAIGM